MTKYEVLLCLYYYLDSAYFADKNKSDEYIYFLGNLNPDIWADEGTADPAYYAVYEELCKDFFPDGECSIEDGVKYAAEYLRKYNEYEKSHFSYSIGEAEEVFSRCTLDEWKKIYNWVKNKRNK